VKSIALLGCTLLLAGVLLACAGTKPPPVMGESKMESAHPAAFYRYASRLFQEGKKDDAVFWFYVGELRYRFYLKAHPNLEPSGDPALFASLHETVGRTINRYTARNQNLWLSQIDKALAWDDQHFNGFTSKTKFKKEYQENRSGLIEMKKSLKASRSPNG